MRTYKIGFYIQDWLFKSMYITCKREELNEKIKEKMTEYYDKCFILQVIQEEIMRRNTKQRVGKGLSTTQKMFANAINYDALDKALEDPEFVALIRKIKRSL